MKWLSTIVIVMIAFFAISTHHLRSIRVVVEFIFTIFFVAFFIIFFVAIIVSIIILYRILWYVNIDSIDSTVELKSMLFDVFDRIRSFNLFDVIRYRFDFLCQASDFFQFSFEHYRIDSFDYRDFQIKMQNLHQIGVLLIIRQFFWHLHF